MVEGILQGSNITDHSMMKQSSGFVIERDQKASILLGGYWIAGTIKESRAVQGRQVQLVVCNGQLNEQEDYDWEVNEASDESFPASDPPAWIDTRRPLRPPTETFPGYYFVADADGTVCGLCAGMHIRIH